MSSRRRTAARVAAATLLLLVLQGCDPQSPFAESETSLGFTERIAQAFPPGSDAGALRHAIAEQGGFIMPSAYGTGFVFQGNLHGYGFWCKPYARVQWNEDRLGRISRRDVSLIATCPQQ